MTGNGLTDTTQHFDYVIDCLPSPPFMSNEMGFCPPPGPCSTMNVDNGTFTFGDIQVTTSLGIVGSSAHAVPALGRWSVVLVGLLLLFGVWLLRRRLA